MLINHRGKELRGGFYAIIFAYLLQMTMLKKR